MISAVMSLVLGVFSLVGPVPVVLPVIGLALGIIALIKERKKEHKKKAVMFVAPVGLAANSFVAVMFILGGMLR
jgi:hypothetical protein